VSGEQDGAERPPVTLIAATLLSSEGVVCPVCPACGSAPEPTFASVSWPSQAMCAADGCPVFVWNPQRPAQLNLEGAREVDLGLEDEGGRS
jgi:hypothetical protein